MGSEIQAFSLPRLSRERRPSAILANASCLLLKLPPELILSFADYLSTLECYLFSQTCSSLRAVLRLAPLPSVLPTTHPDLLHYICMVARNRLDVWVCLECCRLHPVDVYDAPGWNHHEYGEHYGARHTNLIHPPDFFRNFHAKISQCHVQLTIKFLRLHSLCSFSQRSYLQTLLDPYTVYLHCAKDRVGQTLYAPKVVSFNGSLLYLLRGTTHFKNDQGFNISHETLPWTNACKHQDLQPIPRSRQFCYPREFWSCYDQLHKAAIAALKYRGTNNRISSRKGCCPACITDFTVSVTDEGLTLQTWSCLGTEDPANWMWARHMAFPYQTRRKPEHKEGWARHLYGMKAYQAPSD